jgi:hypothetical protein
MRTVRSRLLPPRQNKPLEGLCSVFIAFTTSLSVLLIYYDTQVKRLSRKVKWGDPVEGELKRLEQVKLHLYLSICKAGFAERISLPLLFKYSTKV